MTRKKRIGLVLPHRDPARNTVEGNGILPNAVRAALVEGLREDAEIVECDLSRATVRNGRVYADGTCLSDLDLVHWYFITHQPDSWHMTVLATLAQATRVVPDPAGTLLGLDKFHAHTALRLAGLPTADFALFPADAVHDAAEELFKDGGPVLLKPRLGGFGHGIHMVKSARELVDAVEYTRYFSPTMPQIFCEVFAPNDIARWISTTVIGGELVYGYRKKPEKFVDNWKVYDADKIGGGVDYADPAPVREAALAAARALGCDIIGFDFIYAEKEGRYLIVDENTFPGMYPTCFAAAGGTWEGHFLRMIRAALRGSG